VVKRGHSEEEILRALQDFVFLSLLRLEPFPERSPDARLGKHCSCILDQAYPCTDCMWDELPLLSNTAQTYPMAPASSYSIDSPGLFSENTTEDLLRFAACSKRKCKCISSVFASRGS
jgi:hypothetical protein